MKNPTKTTGFTLVLGITYAIGTIFHDLIRTAFATAFFLDNHTKSFFGAKIVNHSHIYTTPTIELSTARHLALMGVRTCKTLSEIPPRLLEYEFGAPGRQLWKKANGEDDSPVVPYAERDALSTEHTFHTNTVELRVLHDELRRQTAHLACELRRLGKLTSCLTVKMRYADGNTYTRQSSIPHTCHNRALTDKVLLLFDRLFERRQLVRIVGVRFSGLVTGGCQLSLFDDTEKEARLLQAMDRVSGRFGKGAIRKGK